MTTNNPIEDQNKESVVKVELETVVEKVIDEFDNVASITIDHLLTYERPSSIRVRVYTGEADGFEDYLQLFSSEHKIALDRGDQTLLVPFSIFATFDGPVTWDSTSQTTIYMDDNVLGSHSLQVDDGLAYVQDKLENPEQWEWDRECVSPLERIRNYSD
ncbi:hypothetical protein KM295_15080 [Natronomonas sp. F2-12]|uniref:Uncharacterized protein n=1 Tax=Natronomonas aquatica TaxID=2841590 RepID=A0A9R1CWD2_9EURY|nr:hypothetical protein [Natronomonas aquatica]MCQ4334776.1 hypothetical protein [Natronomonas aquatica]